MLDRVTITGADNTTKIADLVSVAADYPFVEWAILMSDTREGSPRYPSDAWQRRFRDAAFTHDLDVSAHICGRWSRSLCAGISPWPLIPSAKDCARRVQINGAAEFSEYELINNLRSIAARERVKGFIFQMPNGANAMRACYGTTWFATFGMFDSSGGAGKSPREWVAPRSGVQISCAGRRYVGYAGGLRTENIAGELSRIEEVCADDFWIDVEGGVRGGDDKLDIGKVRRVLEISSKRIGAGVVKVKP